MSMILLAASACALVPSPAHLTRRAAAGSAARAWLASANDSDDPAVDKAFSADLYAALRARSEPAGVEGEATACLDAEAPADEDDEALADENDDEEAPLDLHSIVEYVRAAGGSAPKIALQLFDGQRGVVATEDVASGELLCEVPYELCFSDDELGMPIKLDPSVRLASAILREKLASPDQQSERIAHLDSIQGAVPVLLHRMAADSIVRKRLPPSLGALVAGLEGRDNDLATALTSTIAQAITGFVPGSTPEALLRWVMDVATTRAYTLARAAAPGVELSIGADESLSALVQRGEAKLTRVVAPLLDNFNHDHGAATQVKIHCAPDGSPLSLRVVAGTPAAAGEQIFLSYGPKSSEALLANYGFVPEGRNPHDRVTLTGALGEVAMAQLAATGVDSRVEAELRGWEKSRFYVYDEGDCALVDRTLVDVNRAAFGGDDRTVALALARRARAELAGFRSAGRGGHHGRLADRGDRGRP